MSVALSGQVRVGEGKVRKDSGLVECGWCSFSWPGWCLFRCVELYFIPYIYDPGLFLYIYSIKS